MTGISLRRILLIGTGIVSLSLGIVGVFVPVLPTTPFLLLAAACFFRSSDRLYAWLIGHRWLGDYIRHYREHRAITWQAKVITLSFLWGVIGYTAWQGLTLWWGRALLGLVAVGVTIHILSLKTLTRQMVDRLRRDPQTDLESSES